MSQRKTPVVVASELRWRNTVLGEVDLVLENVMLGGDTPRFGTRDPLGKYHCDAGFPDEQQPELVVVQRRAALPAPISVMVTTLLLVYCIMFRVNPIPVANDKHTKSMYT